MSTSPDRSSAFVRLPPELRIQIYSQALTTACEVWVIDVEGRHEQAPPVPPLLQTCQQIRAEALELYYSGNTFVAQVLEGETNIARAWLGSLSSGAGTHITELRIEITSDRNLEPGCVGEEPTGSAWRQFGHDIEEAGIPSRAVSVRMGT
ncbi:hypothetical protein LTR65_007356 [Meristemomyces frigidus]